ncbi:helix-turn-helix domain-containing protein [Streptomyces zaomyceticus]|uniref:helix-turn-helix domain-containing protein n=1 Tax=Streptomyces zaomyceticus TaxID=68286 RepID=UPI00379C42E0
MGIQNTSARTSSQSRKGAENPSSRRSSGGVVHDNVRHTTRFTVVGNHLTQHATLSLLAIGLAVHIQSLPAGAPVDIKTLAARFPEGTTRIAAGLRELEVHGYLRRTRERTGNGRVVTRTVSCNQPGRSGGEERPAEPEPRPTARRTEAPRRRALPAVPQPAYPAPDLLVTALDVLVGLRREDPLLAHRLNAQLPPLPPFRTPNETPAVRHPLQNCETCDHAYRAPQPGTCGACRPESH